MSAQAPPAPRVGDSVSSPWWAGASSITQAWGPTDYTGEPEGHGYPHWHAGLDVGLECGTTLTLPHGVAAVARPFLNPGGYGTALRLEVGSSPAVDIILGHLRQVLVEPGQQLNGGEQLAVSNNTGNSSGCHLHFEVRPHGGQYGSDIDPSGWLLNPNGEGATQPYTTGQPPTVLTGFGPTDAIGSAITQFGESLVAQTQAGLGTLLVAAGVLVLVFSTRGGLGGALKMAQGGMAARKGAQQAQAREQAAGQRQLERQGDREVSANREAYRQRAREQDATIRAYRAGLVGQSEAQQRLGLPVRRVRRREAGMRFRRQPLRQGGRTGQAQPTAAQLSRLRPNLARDVAKRAASGEEWGPRTPLEEIPF